MILTDFTKLNFVNIYKYYQFNIVQPTFIKCQVFNFTVSGIMDRAVKKTGPGPVVMGFLSGDGD